MHLFASFMSRSFMALLKDILFVSGIGLASDIIVKNGESYLVAGLETNLECKIFTSFWQYFILANYSWILIEGLYLHNLVFLALFTDSNSSITGYIVLGWGKYYNNIVLYGAKLNSILPLENRQIWNKILFNSFPITY